MPPANSIPTSGLAEATGHTAAHLKKSAPILRYWVEALKDDRAGQYSIRVNDQYRVCFVWTGSDAEDVDIVDYH
jgi:plasmid maintenance system killer protein